MKPYLQTLQMKAGGISFGVVDNLCFPAHWHLPCELVYVMQGTLTVGVNRAAYELCRAIYARRRQQQYPLLLGAELSDAIDYFSSGGCRPCTRLAQGRHVCAATYPRTARRGACQAFAAWSAEHTNMDGLAKRGICKFALRLCAGARRPDGGKKADAARRTGLCRRRLAILRAITGRKSAFRRLRIMLI